MNDYRITATSLDTDRTVSQIVPERDEEAAKDYFRHLHKGKPYSIMTVELVRENTTASKEQEGEALKHIGNVVEELGPDSYVRAAFDGCFADAIENIKNSARNNWKGRAMSLKQELREVRELNDKLIGEKIDLVHTAKDAQRQCKELEDKLREARESTPDLVSERIAGIITKAICTATAEPVSVADGDAEMQESDTEAEKKNDFPEWMYPHIQKVASGHLDTMRTEMMDLADDMADLAGRPDSPEFQNAVSGYLKARNSFESAEIVLAALEKRQNGRQEAQ